MRELVGRVLEEDFRRELCHVGQQDQLRLLVLDSWRQRYKVPVRYILQALLPYYQQRFSRGRTVGLGVRVATLTGKKSEEMLRDAIGRDFPNGEQLTMWKARRRAQLLARRQGRSLGERVRVRGVLDYPTVASYVSSYKQEALASQRAYSKAVVGEENKRRKYRDNPWL